MDKEIEVLLNNWWLNIVVTVATFVVLYIVIKIKDRQ